MLLDLMARLTLPAELGIQVRVRIDLPHLRVLTRGVWSLDMAQVTVVENVCSANAPRESGTRTTNENVPVATATATNDSAGDTPELSADLPA